MPRLIATTEEFYAHALAIEREAAERYEEFTAYFADRGEEVLAGLCANLARQEREHFEELVRACAHLSLPPISAGDYLWLTGESPEAAARELFYRIGTPRALLEIALDAELRAREFFVEIAKAAPLVSVRELASVMAAEEAQHVTWVRQALEYHTTGNADWDALLGDGVGPGTLSGS